MVLCWKALKKEDFPITARMYKLLFNTKAPTIDVPNYRDNWTMTR